MAEKLAIDGGTPVLKRSDYRNWPVINEAVRTHVQDVLDSGTVAGGTAPKAVPGAGGAHAPPRGAPLTPRESAACAMGPRLTGRASRTSCSRLASKP